MTVSFHTFTVGDREYQMIPLDAFKANSYLLKIKDLLGKALAGGMDANAANLLSLIDEKTLNDVIFPLLKDCAVSCITDQEKLQSPEGMRKLFTIDNLDEFYLVAWEVVKVNFGPFISKLAKNLFGVDLEHLAEIVKVKMRTVGELNSGTTSTQNTGSGGL